LWLASNAVPALWQDWDNWTFDRQMHGQSANLSAYVTEKQQRVTDTLAGWLGFAPNREQSYTSGSQPASQAPLANNALIGRLSIPRLSLMTTVREGTGGDILALAVGHIRGTALPGGKGNVAVAGHRDTLFSGLAGIRNNDLIEMETLHGLYHYRVSSFEIVTPDDVSVLKASSFPELTLVTCYPFDYIGPAPKRFIVKARQISGDPPPRHALAAAIAQDPSAPAPAPPRAAPDRSAFVLTRRHSQQLAPGISLGIDEIDAEHEQVNGWLWIMPERRTLWLKDQAAHEPVIFYQDGERRELLITNVTSNSASGILRLQDNTAYARSIVTP
jgi:sortase A